MYNGFRVLPTSQVFTSGYVNTETILHFFYKITNERGTKTVFTYAHVKWFYGQSERAYYLNYFIKLYSISIYDFLDKLLTSLKSPRNIKVATSWILYT